MKNSSLFLFLLFAQIGFSQILPFEDVNDYLKVYYQGQARQLEFQKVGSFKFGDHVLAYQDARNDLKFYNGENTIKVTNLIVNYEVSDTYLVVQASNGLYFIEPDGKPRTLTMYGGRYFVKDSLVLFEDTQMNSWNVVYKGQATRNIMQSTGTIGQPKFVGDNIIVFKDNGDEWKIFYEGQIYSFAVWMDPIQFSVGTDIACFNDPTMNTFAVFENEEFKDVEPQFAQSYKSGKDFIVYQDVNGTLKYYSNGKRVELSNFPSYYDVKDEAIYFVENGFVYTYYNGEKKMVCNYIPKDYQLKNKTIAFRNLMGGVSAFIDGRTVELTTQQDSQYTISGNYVMVSLFNRSYLIYADGKEYNF